MTDIDPRTVAADIMCAYARDVSCADIAAHIGQAYTGVEATGDHIADVAKLIATAGIDLIWPDGMKDTELGAARVEIERRDTELAKVRAKVDELTAALAERDAQLTAANRRADGLQNDLNSAVKANTAYANQQAEAKPDGPWKALIVHESWVADDFSELAPDDEVDIVIVRGSSLPDDEGHMPGTYKTDDVAFEATDIYVDGDGGTDAPTIYARAQVMAAGLNAAEAEVTR